MPQIKLNIFSNLQILFLKRPDNILKTFKRRFILSINPRLLETIWLYHFSTVLKFFLLYFFIGVKLFL